VKKFKRGRDGLMTHEEAVSLASDVAAYIRVSTRAQNYATQRDAIERAAKVRGETVERWFEEKRTAKKLDRPVLKDVRELSRRGCLRKLYVFRLDRLARSGIRDMLMVLEELETHGTKVISVSDGIDLEGPARDVIVSVLAWAAQWEHRAHGERVSAARARVEASGGQWGRPRSVSLADARRAIERRKNGESIRDIARAMKIPRSTVAEVLSDKTSYARMLKKHSA